MSLIVDALKRAQQGATRRPPLSGPTASGPLPGARVVTNEGALNRRLLVFALAVTAVILIFAVVLRFGGSRVAPPPAKGSPGLLVVEPVGQSKPADGSGTSIEEVRAALLAAQPLETSAARENATDKPDAPPVVKRRTPSARAVPRKPPVVAPRVAATEPAPASAGGAAAISPGTRPAAPSRETATVVKVHPEPAVEAAEMLTAGLQDQQAGRTAKAIEEYRRGIRADGRNPGLYNNLGVALRESGRLDEAVEAFKAALNIDSKYEKALNNLGVSRYQQGQYTEAIDLFNQTLRINPANVESAINTGMIYFLAQRWDEALTAFQQALRYDPRSAEAHYNLGLLWERRGDQEKALKSYRRFVELAGGQQAQLAARVSEHIRQMERSK